MAQAQVLRQLLGISGQEVNVVVDNPRSPIEGTYKIVKGRKTRRRPLRRNRNSPRPSDIRCPVSRWSSMPEIPSQGPIALRRKDEEDPAVAEDLSSSPVEGFNESFSSQLSVSSTSRTRDWKKMTPNQQLTLKDVRMYNLEKRRNQESATPRFSSCPQTPQAVKSPLKLPVRRSSLELGNSPQGSPMQKSSSDASPLKIPQRRLSNTLQIQEPPL